MPGYFITATGTGIGKTFITSALTWQLRAAGIETRAIKPLITGFDPATWHGSDTAEILTSMGRPLTLENAAAISPWRLSRPAAPHMAAASENRRIYPPDIEDFCRQKMAMEGLMIVEGAGGVWVPITLQYNQMDLMKGLGLPVILVTSNYLGSISHTMTAIESLRQRKIKLHTVIVNESAAETAPPLEEVADTFKILIADAKIRVLTISRLAPAVNVWKTAPSFWEMIHDRK